MTDQTTETESPGTERSPAQVAYEAYTANPAAWVSDFPWAELPPSVRHAFEQIARAAAEAAMASPGSWPMAKLAELREACAKLADEWDTIADGAAAERAKPDRRDTLRALGDRADAYRLHAAVLRKLVAS